MGIIKLIHVSCAMISIIGFVSRALLAIKGSPLMQARWIKTVPHFVDTALLVSAVILALQFGFTPANSPWLAAKLVAVLFYIGFGFIALRYARTNKVRVLALSASVLTFSYMVSVAITKSPLPFL